MRVVKFIVLMTLTAITGALVSGDVRAQTPSMFTTGLKAPAKIIAAGQDNLFVAEAGNGPNTGRISIVDRRMGARRTLIDGLPSGIETASGNTAPSGPSGLVLRGRTLYLTIGAGDAVLAGPAPGTEKPNPNPASPLLSSVLALHFSGNAEKTIEGFALTLADQTALKNGERVTLSEAGGGKIRIELVSDFPDYVPNPRPDYPENVRSSNPFGVTVDANQLYVVDASLNNVRRVDIHTGSVTTLVSFPPLRNPLPFGPPVVEPVPDSIRLFGDALLVPFLIGFPFPPGVSEVHKVEVATGRDEKFIGNLTSAIDVLPVKMPGGESVFYVLEFSSNMRENKPGRLLRFDSPTATPSVVAEGLISPTSVARDDRTGDLFVTEIFTGRIVKIASGAVQTRNKLDEVNGFVEQQYLDFLNRAPDQAGLTFWTGKLNEYLAACGAGDNMAANRCRQRARARVSEAFFVSIEFQGTGYFVYRLYRAAFPVSEMRPRALPRFNEFIGDTQEVGRGVVVNADGWQEKLEANKDAFARRFVERREFIAMYPTTMNANDYVESLYRNAGLQPTSEEQQAALDAYGAGGTEGRAKALRVVAETGELFFREFNAAFVLIEYFGYLRRNPDDPEDISPNTFRGYDFWLTKLNSAAGDYRRFRTVEDALAPTRNAEMVEAFTSSGEYRRRFGME